MSVARLWHWLTGYVIMKITGPQIESFLNLAAGAGIPLWQIRRLGRDMAVLCVGARDIPKLRKIRRRARVRLAVRGRHGLPFIWQMAWGRKAWLLGALLGLVIIWHFTSILWFVRVDGVEGQIRVEIEEALSQWGLAMGTPRSRVNPDEIERQIQQNWPMLSWVNPRLEGVVLLIEVAEKVIEEEQTLPTRDLVARRPGLIEQVLVLEGVPHVRNGMTVERGDLLIQGIGNQGRVVADGYVVARVWYDVETQVSLLEERLVPSGRERHFLELTILGRTLRLGRLTYSFWERNQGEQRKLPGGVEWVRVSYREMVPVYAERTAAEATELARTRARQILDGQRAPGGEVLSTSWSIQQESGVVKARLEAEVREDLGQGRLHD